MKRLVWRMKFSRTRIVESSAVPGWSLAMASMRSGCSARKVFQAKSAWRGEIFSCLAACALARRYLLMFAEWSPCGLNLERAILMFFVSKAMKASVMLQPSPFVNCRLSTSRSSFVAMPSSKRFVLALCNRLVASVFVQTEKMSTVYRGQPLSTTANRCQPLPTTAYRCFTTVLPLVPTAVYHCLPLFTAVNRCQPRFTTVNHCFQKFLPLPIAVSVSLTSTEIAIEKRSLANNLIGNHLLSRFKQFHYRFIIIIKILGEDASHFAK